ncbi:MAG: helix-turn-helix transcriptional regulator [Actinomycetota bacterium]|nr:helix-turn-helix transcriptional regulator [Actinomycetota bacterium]
MFVISVAAQLAGMHAQTLRQYDRLGLVSPGRTPGGGRRYSARDILRLQTVARLSHQEGINLAGIKRIIELESAVTKLEHERDRLAEELELSEQRRLSAESAVHASYRRDLVPLNQQSLVFYRARPRPPR